MRALLIGDVHLGPPPSIRTQSYPQDILNKLAWCVQYANEHADVIVQLGDMWHLKNPSRTSHALAQSTASVLEQFKGRVLIVPGNHDLCVSEDSEGLTDQGWKKLDQLNGTEKFATLNPNTHSLEWQYPSRINSSYRDESMLHFSSKSVDHLVTPNHDLYVNVGSSFKHLSRGWSKKKACEHPSYGSAWRVLTTSTGDWSGITPEEIYIPNPTGGKQLGFSIPSHLACRLFGWYVAEGSTSEGTSSQWPTRTTISQSLEKSPENYQEICELLDEIGLNYTKTSIAVRINNRPLTEFLSKEFGSRSQTKVVPSWLMSWSSTDILNFLYCYFKGDGTVNGRGTSVLDADCVSVRTSSSTLANSMQSLCSQIGWTVTIGGWRDYPVAGTDYVGHALTYSFKRRQMTQVPLPVEIQYSGQVWCPTLPNGIWMVRRNGKALWTGNSQDRLESLPSQPLGTLALSPNIELLDGYDEETRIVGIPYLDSFEDFHARFEGLEAEPIDPAPILIATHASIFPDNQSPPYAHMNASDIDTGGIPLAYGHIHDPHGFYEVNDTWFCNNGAISRGSLHEETVKREPAVTIFDSEAQGCPFTSVPIPFRPASEVFRLAEHVEKVEAQAKLDGFLESITSVQLTNLSLEQVIEHAKNAGLPETAQQELEDIVQFAQS